MKVVLAEFFDQEYSHEEVKKVIDSLPSRWRSVCIQDGDKVQRMRSPERRRLGPIPEELEISDDEQNLQQNSENGDPFDSNRATGDCDHISQLSQEMNQNLSGIVKSI